MGKFYFAFAWDLIVNLHVCICKNKICIWSDPGVNLPVYKYTPVCICVRMRYLLTLSKICTPEYIYMCVFLAHANWTLLLNLEFQTGGGFEPWNSHAVLSQTLYHMHSPNKCDFQVSAINYFIVHNIFNVNKILHSTCIELTCKSS